MYGHIAQLAEAEANGIRQAGGTVDIYQVPETLPAEVLTKMHAPGQTEDKYKILHDPSVLEQYDGFLFGIPTRYGNFPAQWKAFIDKTGQQWATGAFYGKYAGVFVSTASLGGGQETTALSALSTFVHHGINFVPLGYKTTFEIQSSLDEVRGGSPWGAGTFAVSLVDLLFRCYTDSVLQGGQGQRQPSKNEITLAERQGAGFFETLNKVNFGSA